MHNIRATQVERARTVAFDLASLVLRAAAVGLSVALMLAGATLLFSSQTEAAADVPRPDSSAASQIAAPGVGEPK